MEHAKKLMLVDPKMYRASMRDKTLSKLDEEIEQTLNSELSDGDKALNYIDALRRYKFYGIEPLTDKKEEKDEKMAESEILATVSSDVRHKAKRLMDHLKQDPSFKIGGEGEIFYNQQKISHSHVGDLLNDILEKKKTTVRAEEPPGWREFSNSLKSLGVPRDLITNTDRRNYMYPRPQKTEKIRKNKKATAAAAEVGDYKASSTPSRTRTRKKVSLRSRWLEYDDDDDEQ